MSTQKPLSIVFLGTSEFAVPSLQALAKDNRFIVTLVITQPDRPVGRKQELTPPPVKVEAQKLGIKVEQPEKIKTVSSDIQSMYDRPDFLVAVSYGQLLPQEILDWPTVAPVNVHASLLPLLRGASPLQHAILQDFRETGVTVQKMQKELDSGPVLSQASIALDRSMTLPKLHDTLASMGAELLVETLAKPLNPKEQDHSKATFCGKLKKSDGIVDPKTMTAADIDRKVRALSPWPGVTWETNKLVETQLESGADTLPIECKDGTLYVRTIQPPGKKPMSGQAFARGRMRS